MVEIILLKPLEKKKLFHITDMFHFKNFSGRSGLIFYFLSPSVLLLTVIPSAFHLLLFIIDVIVSAY